MPAAKKREPRQEELLRQNEELRNRLAEAEETLRAIRADEVDALVVAGVQDREVHLMGKSNRIYRQFIEAASEGAATLSADGTILSCNALLARTLRRPLGQVLGTSMRNHLSPDDHESFNSIIAHAGRESGRRRIRLKTSDGSSVPGYLSATLLHRAGAAPVICVALTDLEEVVSAEEALRESEAHYRALFECNPQPMWVYDLETLAFLLVNDSAIAHYGYTRDEFLTMTIKDIRPPEEVPRLLAQVYGARESVDSAGIWVHRRKDGSTLLVEITSHTIDYDGRPGELVLAHDVTEHKRAEDALRASRQLIEGIINAIPVRVFWKDTNLVYLGCNVAFARDAGYADPQDVIGKDDFRMGWRDQADRYRADDRQVMESGVSKLFIEEPQTTPDGKTIILLTSKLPLRNARGEICGVLGTYHDITEHKRAELALRESEEKFRSLFDDAEVAMFRSRLDGSEILDVNQKFLELVGQTREQTIGKPSAFLWAVPEEREELVRRLVADGKVSEYEFEMLNQHQGRRNCVVSLRLYREQGILMGSVSDITERKRLAEEKAQLETELRQAQKVEAIGRLAGGVAHDFNNLTAIVLGYGEMLLGQLRAEDPARKWAEQIVEAGRRSAALTRQLLAFSRRQVLLPVVLDLNDLLRNLQGLLGRLIGEDIHLELRLAPDLACITADPGQIEQVVTNLVINARDAMPRGGRLTFETANAGLDEAFAREHAGVVPGAYVRFALTDTGCGMDQATQARIFEPFFTTKDRGKGTGLGLATAFGVIKQSGGYLYVASVPGRGTTFTIYLPATNSKPKARPVEDAGESSPRGSGERVLLVDDEAPMRELCASVLLQLGYRVSSARSGAEALQMVETMGLEPDLVLTDVIMPGMGGGETVERLRAARPGLKALYISGYPDEAIASHGVLKPGMCFLQKPFTKSGLAAKLREALGAKPAPPPQRRSVLMIDDDAQFIDLLRHFLRKRGHGFAGTSSAPEALEALAREPFDLLLVDLNLPGSSGEQVLREIRAAGHAVPAIVLTGDVASADLGLLRPLGVIRALEKSSNAEPLLRAIEEAGAA